MNTVFLVLLIWHSDINRYSSAGEQISVSYTRFESVEECEAARPFLVNEAKKLIAMHKDRFGPIEPTEYRVKSACERLP